MQIKKLWIPFMVEFPRETLFETFYILDEVRTTHWAKICRRRFNVKKKKSVEERKKR